MRVHACQGALKLSYTDGEVQVEYIEEVVLTDREKFESLSRSAEVRYKLPTLFKRTEQRSSKSRTDRVHSSHVAEFLLLHLFNQDSLRGSDRIRLLLHRSGSRLVDQPIDISLRRC